MESAVKCSALSPLLGKGVVTDSTNIGFSVKLVKLIFILINQFC